jgi:hypothetical protein
VILYKYLSAENAIRVLDGMRIKVALPNECNDPFEFTPITKVATQRDWLHQLETNPESFRDLHQMYLNEGKWTPSWDKFLRGLPAAIKKYSPHARKLLGPLLRNEDLDFYNKASHQVGVLCVSEVVDSIPMWAHYGDDQKGAVIAINSNDPAFSRGIFGKVRYVSRRVRLDLRKATDKDKTRLAFRKSKEWAYEQEYRFLFHQTDLLRQKISDGRIGHFVDIWGSTIESVIFGCSILEDREKELRSLLKTTRRFAHVKVLRAHRHFKKFTLIVS